MECSRVPEQVVRNQELGATTRGAYGPGPCAMLAEKVMYAVGVSKAKSGMVSTSMLKSCLITARYRGAAWRMLAVSTWTAVLAAWA